MCPPRNQSQLPRDRLAGIDTFVQVVEAGSFALAAQRTRVTRSAIAKVIARLERRLGERLFNRTTRSLSLTDAGQAYYQRCKRAIAELDAAEAVFEDGRREPSGRLRVSAPVVFGRIYVAPVLTALAKQYERLAIELAFSDRIVDLVEEGFDLAVRIGELPDSTTLAARRLGINCFVMCASPSYLARRGHPRKPEEFAGHVGVGYLSRGPDAPWEMRDASGSIRPLQVDRRLRLDDLQAIADAALEGAGIARLPRWLADPHLRAGRLVLLRNTERGMQNEIHAVWPRTHYLTAKMRVALDALAREVPARLATAGAD
jgi:DNA-binding transcriptional LysR family regulator